MALTKQKLLHKRSSVVGRILAPSALTYGEIAVNFSSGANNSFLEIKKYDDKPALYFEHPYGAYSTTISGATAGYWSANISGITEYYDGLSIRVRLGTTYDGSWNTLNVNGLGSKIVWRVYNGRMTSHYGQWSELTLTYRTNAGSFQATATARGLISGTTYKDGWIIESAYYSDDIYRLYEYYSRYCTGPEKMNPYMLFGLDENEKTVPLVVSGGTGTAKPVNQRAFRPDKIYYCNTGSAVNANTVLGHGSIADSTYVSGGIRYVFNSDGPAYTTIYLKGKLNDSGMFVLSSGITDFYRFVPYDQTALTLTDYFEEGWYYIRVGRTYSSANSYYLNENNPLFYFDGTNLIEISPLATMALSGGTALSAVTSQSAMTANSAGTLYNWLHIYKNGSRIASFNGSGTTSALTTDNKVYQSNSTTSSFRPIMLGYQTASTIGGATLTAATTQQVYTAKKVGVQPSTGKIVAAGGFALSADTTNVLIGNGGSIEQDTLSPSVSITNSGSTNSAAQSVVYGAVTGGTKGHSVTLLRTNKIYSASTADSATTASSASTAGKLSGSLNIYKNGTLLTTYDGSSTLSALTTDTNPSVTAGTVGTGVVTGITASGTSNHAIVGLKTTAVKVNSATTTDKAISVEGTAGTADAYRNVWFSWSDAEAKRATDTQFQYNPAKNAIKVSAVTMNGTNIIQVPNKAGTFALTSDIDNALTSSVNYKGATSTVPASASTKVGDLWIAASAISLTATQSATGAAQNAEIGDFLIARANNKWDVVQKNIDGAVTAGSDLSANYVVLGNGNRTIKTSAYTIATSVPAGAVFTDTATTIGGHYDPSAIVSGTTTGARITGLTIDRKGHVTGISTAATDNVDTKVTSNTGATKAYILAHTGTSINNTAQTHANAYVTAGKVYSNNSETVNLADAQTVTGVKFFPNGITLSSSTSFTADTYRGIPFSNSETFNRVQWVENNFAYNPTKHLLKVSAITMNGTNAIQVPNKSGTIALLTDKVASASTSDISNSLTAYTTAGSVRGVYTVNIPNVTALTDGMVFKIKLDHAYNNNWNSLKINDLEALPLWYAFNSKMTSHYSTNAEICVTYRTSAASTALVPTNSDSGLTSGKSYTNGFVIESNYVDGNNTYDNRAYYAYYRTDENGVNAYMLCGLDKNEKLTPLVLSGGTGTTKPVNTKGFKPDKILCAFVSSRVAAYTNINHGSVYWSIGSSVARYSFNASWPVYTTCYLKGTLKSDGLFYLATGLTDYYRFVPYNSATTMNLNNYFETGFYYIRVGRSYSSADYYYLEPNNPMFYYDGTNLIEIKPLSQRTLSAGTASSADIANSANTLTHALTVKQNTTTIGSWNGSANTTFTLSDSATTYAGHYAPAKDSTSARTQGARITGITIDGKGHVVAISSAATDNVDTKVTDANGTGKAFLLGHTTQGSNATAVSNANVYMSGGALYSESKKVLTGETSVTVTVSGSGVVVSAMTAGTNGHNVVLGKSVAVKVNSASTADSATQAVSATTSKSATTAAIAVMSSGVVRTLGETNVYRDIWFSHATKPNHMSYDDDFQYNPATNLLKVSGFTNGTTRIVLPASSGTLALEEDIERLDFMLAATANDLNERKLDKADFSDSATTYDGHYTPAGGTATTGARITGITLDGKGHVTNVATAATDNVDEKVKASTATTKAYILGHAATASTATAITHANTYISGGAVYSENKIVLTGVTGGVFGSGAVTGITVSGTAGNRGIALLKTTGLSVTCASTAYNVNGEAGTVNQYRNVWFSDSSTETKRNSDTQFQYNPGNNSLKVSALTMSGTNIIQIPNKAGTMALTSDIPGATAGTVGTGVVTGLTVCGTTNHTIVGLKTTAVKVNSATTADTAFKISSQAATSDAYRNVWFSYEGTDGRLVTDSNFQYNPSKNLLKVSGFTNDGGTTRIVLPQTSGTIALTSDLTGNTDTATTETGHYTPSTSASTAGTATAGQYINRIFLDSKKHVIAVTTAATTSVSVANSGSTNSAAQSVVYGIATGGTHGHSLTLQRTNKIYSASTADSATIATNLQHPLHIYQNGTRIATYSGGTIVSARTSDSATTYAGHYTPSSDSTATTSGARITGITKDGKGHIISIATAATDNTDTKVTDANSSGKTFLLGHTTQGTNATAQTYTNVYMSAGTIAATEYKVEEKAVMKYNTTNQCIDFVFI